MELRNVAKRYQEGESAQKAAYFSFNLEEALEVEVKTDWDRLGEEQRKKLEEKIIELEIRRKKQKESIMGISGVLTVIGISIFGAFLVVSLSKTYTTQILLTIAAIATTIIIFGKLRDAAKHRQVEESVRIKKHKEKQDGYLKQLAALCEDSITIFEQMPEYLKRAEEYLNQAEFEFSEGAFAPFWDAIEKAAKTLGRFDEGVEKIKNNSSQYTDLITKYEGAPPKFPLSQGSVKKLSIGTSTAKRMEEIVRTAQRNFQFATIYEQRKTNQILVAGFTNLAQALDRMTWQITESINNLAGSVGSMASTLNESMRAIHSRLGDMAAEVARLESERAAREKRALQMLDNIQRHRKPNLIL